MLISPAERLPVELFIMILTNLENSELDACSKTCSKWKRIAYDQELWQKVVAKVFRAWNFDPSTSFNFLKMSHQIIESNAEIVLRIQEFLNKFKSGQKAKLTCFSGSGVNYQTCSIEILPTTSFAFGPSSWEINNSDFDVDKHYFSLKSFNKEETPRYHLLDTFIFDYKRNYYYQERFMGGRLESTDIIGYYYVNGHKARFIMSKDLQASELRFRVHKLMQDKMEQLGQTSRWLKTDCPIL